MATPESEEEVHSQITDLEKAFQDCLTNLTSQEYFAPNEADETKQSVEHILQHFLDTARRTEAFFLSQRLSLSVQKPEQMLKEDITELRQELERKEKLVEKHHERLQAWISLLHRSTAVPPPSSATSITQQSSFPLPSQSQSYSGHPQQPSPGLHSQGGPPTGQYAGPLLTGGQGYGMPPPQQPPPSYPQNHPLTFLEQNLSNIGMPERR